MMDTETPDWATELLDIILDFSEERQLKVGDMMCFYSSCLTSIFVEYPEDDEGLNEFFEVLKSAIKNHPKVGEDAL